MPNKDSLGDRIKRYEIVSQNQLIRRMPVIIRLDGKAFHTFTKKITPKNDSSLAFGPFSHKLHDIMADVTYYLADNIQNAKFAYTQSDEISILLTDWENFGTEQFFDGNVQKIVSVSASMATAVFNNAFAQKFTNELSVRENLAFFDSRVFNIPKEDVTNYFIWRQQDTSRNSVQMLGRHYFSHKQLQNKNNSQIQDMLMLEHGINWNDLHVWKKRGTCVFKGSSYTQVNKVNKDYSFYNDKEPPIFTQNRAYIDRYVKDEENTDD